MVNISRTLIFNDRYSYYRKHLEIICSVLPVSLSSRELDVLAYFLQLDKGLCFSSVNRKNCLEFLGLKSGGLGNYLKALREKGFIKVTEEGVMYIPEVLYPSGAKYQEYNFKIIHDEV